MQPYPVPAEPVSFSEEIKKSRFITLLAHSGADAGEVLLKGFVKAIDAMNTWIGQAFASADGDKSGAVNKTELTGFLSRGA